MRRVKSEEIFRPAVFRRYLARTSKYLQIEGVDAGDVVLVLERSGVHTGIGDSIRDGGSSQTVAVREYFWSDDLDELDAALAAAGGEYNPR